jgi:NADH-quinone oxidoreductase subunit H
MVSYELAMGLSLVVLFMCFGTVQLDEIARLQSGAIWNWGVFQAFPLGLIAFVVFWTSVFAETNRTPFDMPEDDASLVAGYHTEYSSLRFALFFMAEYANMVVASAVTATLFFGGYNFPFLDGAAIRQYADYFLMAAGLAAPLFLVFAYLATRRRERPFYKTLKDGDMRRNEPMFFAGLFTLAALVNLGVCGLGFSGIVSGSSIGPELVAFFIQLNMLVVKTLIGCFMFIQVRWTVPRFRYDQVMTLGWKYMLPLSLANVFLTGVWILAAEKLFA